MAKSGPIFELCNTAAKIATFFERTYDARVQVLLLICETIWGGLWIYRSPNSAQMVVISGAFGGFYRISELLWMGSMGSERIPKRGYDCSPQRCRS